MSYLAPVEHTALGVGNHEFQVRRSPNVRKMATSPDNIAPAAHALAIKDSAASNGRCLNTCIANASSCTQINARNPLKLFGNTYLEQKNFPKDRFHALRLLNAHRHI